MNAFDKRANQITNVQDELQLIVEENRPSLVSKAENSESIVDFQQADMIVKELENLNKGGPNSKQDLM